MRYLRLLGSQLRSSTAIAMQYRVEFLVQGVLSVFWSLWSLAPILVVYGRKSSIAGWSFEEALVVVGWFMLMEALLEGAINPSLVNVVEQIRTGTLDFVLIKPADAQFLVSTARFDPRRIIDLFAAFALFGVVFHRMGRAPALDHVLAALGLLLCATVVLYSLWILVISAAFYVIKIDNLAHLFTSIFDAARWPVTVFRGFWRVLFTFVIPLALMTTYPALALLGRLTLRDAVLAACGAATFAVVARLVWIRSISRYTSASS
jgi:ABC-2 type transport system permease protein